MAVNRATFHFKQDEGINSQFRKLDCTTRHHVKTQTWYERTIVESKTGSSQRGSVNGLVQTRPQKVKIRTLHIK